MKIKLNKNQWEKMGKMAGWMKQAQESIDWDQKGPIQDYVKQCVGGMIDLRGGISRQNAAGQLVSHLINYYEWINKRVNVAGVD